MTIEADAQQLQVNAAVCRDELFVLRTFRRQILRHAVRQKRITGGQYSPGQKNDSA